jgi:hypothetical protein
MNLRTLAIACLACCLACDGCGGGKDRPGRQASSRGAPVADPADSSGQAWQRAQLMRVRLKARPAAGPASKPGATLAPASVAAESGPATRPEAAQGKQSYRDSAETSIGDYPDKVRTLTEGIGKLSEQQEERFEALVSQLDARIDEAFQALTELDSAPQDQWAARKLRMERAMANIREAYLRLSDFVMSTHDSKLQRK